MAICKYLASRLLSQSIVSNISSRICLRNFSTTSIIYYAKARPSPTRRQAERSFQAPKECTDFPWMLPPFLIESAQGSKLLPFGPAKAYTILAAFLHHHGSSPPSETCCNSICAETFCTPRHIAVLAHLLMKIPQATNKDSLFEIKGSEWRNTLARYLLANAAAAGDPDAIVTQYDQLVAAAKSTPARFLTLELREALQRLEAAALRVDPSSERARLRVGRLREQQGDIKAAKEWYQRAAAVDPGKKGSGIAYLRLGRLAHAAGDIAGARDAWTTGAVHRDSADCYMQLAVLVGESDSNYETYLLKAGSSGVKGAAHRLAVLYHFRGELLRAKEWYSVSLSEGLGQYASASNLVKLLKKEGTLNEELMLWAGPEWVQELVRRGTLRPDI